MIELGRELKGNPIVFPTGMLSVCSNVQFGSDRWFAALLLHLLESKAVETVPRPHPLWVVSALREVGLPYATIFRQYHGLIEGPEVAWREGTRELHLIRAQTALVAHWFAEATDPLAPMHDGAQFRAASREIANALGKYKVMVASKDLIGENVAELARELAAVQKRVEAYAGR